MACKVWTFESGLCQLIKTAFANWVENICQTIAKFILHFADGKRKWRHYDVRIIYINIMQRSARLFKHFIFMCLQRNKNDFDGRKPKIMCSFAWHEEQFGPKPLRNYLLPSSSYVIHIKMHKNDQKNCRRESHPLQPNEIMATTKKFICKSEKLLSLSHF